MAPNCLECLTEDGNYSKLRIGLFLLGIFSIAFFIWLIVLTVNLNQINGNEEKNPDMSGWTILTESQPICGNHFIGGKKLKNEEECIKFAASLNESNYIWMVVSRNEPEKKPVYCNLLKTCDLTKAMLPGEPGKMYYKDSKGKFRRFAVTENRMCAEKENNTIVEKADVYYEECFERAENSEDVNFMMYGKPLNAKGTKSKCVLYKECDLKDNIKVDQPIIILQRIK